MVHRRRRGCRLRADSEKELVAFVQIEDKAELDALKFSLRRQVPHYMLPQRIVPIQNIPRTDRGKVDRQLLIERYATA
mgnify:CR=1 FL=1